MVPGVDFSSWQPGPTQLGKSKLLTSLCGPENGFLSLRLDFLPEKP